MKVCVTGAGGLLGTTLVPLWRRAGAEVVPWGRAELDVTDGPAVRRSMAAAGPDLVVHLAAYTDVDGAEADAETAMRVNGAGTAHVAGACREAGVRMIYVSTDYVFDGATPGPIPPDAPAAPLGAYGRSKLQGERSTKELGDAGVIVRTGWVYGPGGGNFVDTMRREAAARNRVTVVADQRGAPTPTRLIAEVLWGLVCSGATGAWHVMAAGSATWFEVARAVYEDSGAPADLVTPCATAGLGRPAPRPANSTLECRATERRIGHAMPFWRDPLSRYVRSGSVPGLGLIAESDG